MNYTNKILSIPVCACALASAFVAPAQASQLVFTGQNTALFSTANPNSTAALMNSVTKPNKGDSYTPPSTADMIQNSVVSQIGAKIYNDIFSGTASTGFYDLGGGNSITYTREGGSIIVTIINAKTGTTIVTVPDV